MSLNKIDEVKRDRGFRVGDLVVYGIIALVIVGLFVTLAFTLDKSPANGINVYYRNDVVFFYYFDSAKYKVVDASHAEITSDGLNTLEIRFYGTDKDEFNDIVIDKDAHSVYVKEANCSLRKDCVHAKAITDKSGIISCFPHGMKIQPLDYEIDPNDPNVGPPIE